MTKGADCDEGGPGLFPPKLYCCSIPFPIIEHLRVSHIKSMTVISCLPAGIRFVVVWRVILVVNQIEK